MIGIRQVDSPVQKAHICDTILHNLPSWFGVEASIADYVDKTQSMPSLAIFDEGKPIGFVALKVHNPYTSEVCVMGILEEYHRHGLGRKLIECCESFCFEHHNEYLTVKTLDSSVQSDS